MHIDELLNNALNIGGGYLNPTNRYGVVDPNSSIKTWTQN
ncbi:hypothetical protein Lbys_2222 [Leadbetterella byssophila DSM 17132]|uniref:Uncharacterized protein n=1 Tax=Leadbetterella byssophila (strain DSM 17132 / JCM 16389 / KACC 11308 / NBRC 106382 / 4M15) TaxID=649349 RepID=E4RV27_LEAB4|nr:hypothetical protein Lbys_2222 [Leadbetterella byssophila DSM 17132]